MGILAGPVHDTDLLEIPLYHERFLAYVSPDNPLYAHLVDATYALIGAENEATKNPENAMFSEKTIIDMPDVKERIAYYKNKA